MHKHSVILALCAVVCALPGCEEGPPRTANLAVPTGIGEQGPLIVDDMVPESTYVKGAQGQESIRRLTRSQFDNAIYQMFDTPIVVPKIAEPDVARGGLTAIGASAVTYSARGVESIEAAAYSIAEQALSSDNRSQNVPCGEPDVIAPDCVQDTLRRWCTKAWRRPPTPTEETDLKGLFDQANDVLGQPYEALQFPLAAIIQSPFFLYRIEVGLGTDGEVSEQLSAFELAARLSFFLWNMPPDEALMQAAMDGTLDTRGGLFDEAQRMLEHPNAREGMRALFDDHLKLYELDHLSKDPTVFEHFNDRLGAFAREETLRLIDDLIFDHPRDFRELLTSRTTFINPMLASIYKVPAPARDDFGEARLPDSTQRAGLLGHVSFLATHAHSRASSATRRGLAVRTILLCQSIPSPPVDVDTSIPEPTAEAQTLRERVASHLEAPSCAGCHQLTDPIGLGLENFDGIGRFRTTEYDTRIDPSGELDGVPFSDAVELGGALAAHPDFLPCVVKVLSRYAIGRLESGIEKRWIELLTHRFAVHGHQLKPLLLELITSPMFRTVGGLKEAQ